MTLKILCAVALTLTAACGTTVAQDSSRSSGSGMVGDEAPGDLPETCEPGAQAICYSGPLGTEGIGVCRAGVRACDADGHSSNECAGEVVPGAEVCASIEDETCDGDGACTGKLAWARDHEGEIGEGGGADVAADPWGNVLATGRFNGSFKVSGLALESDDYDAFIVKLDPAGKGLWARQAHGGAGSAITSDADGNVFVAGTFSESVDLGDGILTTTKDFSDLFVAKFDPDGGLLWSRSFGGPGYQWAEEIAVDADGNAVIMGGLHDGADLGDGYKPAFGETDLFVLKLDRTGERVWSRHFGTTGYDYGMAVALDASGAALITGSFDGTLSLGGDQLKTAGSDDVFMAKLSPGGEHVWSRRFGGDNHDLGRGIGLDPAGNIVIAGLFSTSVDFGGGPIAAGGLYGAFVARYDSQGAHLGSQGFGAAGATAYAIDVAVDGAGNAVIFGLLTGTASFGGPPLSANGSASEYAEDLFVAKYDPAGQHVYSYVFGDAARQRAYGLAVDGSGSALLTGDFQGTVDFGSGPLAAPAPSGWDLFITKLAP